jgi:hypothetical protein
LGPMGPAGAARRKPLERRRPLECVGFPNAA